MKRYKDLEARLHLNTPDTPVAHMKPILGYGTHHTVEIKPTNIWQKVYVRFVEIAEKNKE